MNRVSTFKNTDNSLIMKKLVTPYLLFAASLFAQNAFAQVVLTADGPGNTYELINSVLAPGYDAVEDAECTTAPAAHAAFGRHVAEVFDAALNQNVFEFYIHRDNDNDRCTVGVTDRQRVEIKTYDQSPDNLKGIVGETVTYKWKFKIPTGFQPSSNFTHIHQVKAVGGDDGNPLFTITLRKGTPNKLEVNYYDATLPNNVLTKLVNVNMSSFENVWVEATEIIKIGANGTYSMVIKRVSDNVVLVNYSDATIVSIRPDNTFLRPKWGIYRSLLSVADLRDDAIRFNSFSIQEGAVMPVEMSQFNAKTTQKAVLLTWKTESEKDNDGFHIEQSTNGKDFQTIGQVKGHGTTVATNTYSFEHKDPSVSTHYYRLKQVDFNGATHYSPVRSVVFGKANLSIKTTLVRDALDVETEEGSDTSLSIFNTFGQQVLTHKGQGTQHINVSSLPIGAYFIRTNAGTTGRFVKQ
jgi:hypothetical protein